MLLKERKQVRLLFILGIMLGAIAGFIGGIFQLSVRYLIHLKEYICSYSYTESLILEWSLSIIIPVILVVVSIWLVKRFAPETGGSGVQEIEGSLERKRWIRWNRVLPVKFFAGSLSLSSGLILGREGPTIQMGGALGKMISRVFHVGPEHSHILIAAGAGGGLAAAFNAPLAGILFVIEEMHTQFKWSFKSLQCVIVTSIISDVVVRIILGSKKPDIIMTQFAHPSTASLWIFIVFGCIFGVMGVIFNKYIIKALDFYTKKKGIEFWISIVVTAAVFGILTKVYPDITGGGYEVIPKALNFEILPATLLLIFFLRMVTTWVSYGSGVPGGIFAPMLALGTVFGMSFGYYANLLFPSVILDPGMFAVAGMAALFTATVGAPLTGTVLVVEMTMNYELIVPLLLTCFSATMVAYFIGHKPIYSTLLERTIRLTKEKAKEEFEKEEKEE
ncbi:MAG: H(+)/Cl(-) exchange transporter ClcA [Victivallales bacterium]|nr:H(+)/Cl(-) exchange transporter ClcA [Victivallales bacterium]